MKCILILPYFGKFKNYFELFLKSCKYNPHMNWLLITDNEDNISYPENFIIKRMTFKHFQNLVQSKFDFPISLETPYKLCDYKPAYGYICEEWIKDYDYWGHCDCDLIFGDLTPVFSLLEKGYDKLFTGGHLTIYRNSFDNNRIFMSEYLQYGYLYKKVFSSKMIYAFDEVYYSANVDCIFENQGKNIYSKDLAYNCSTRNFLLKRETYLPDERRWIEERHINDQMYWHNGHLYRIYSQKFELHKEEYIYIHLQMRKMKLYIKSMQDCNIIKINSDCFIEFNNLPRSLFEFIKRKQSPISIKQIYSIYRKIKRKLLKRKLPIKWIKPWLYNPYE